MCRVRAWPVVWNSASPGPVRNPIESGWPGGGNALLAMTHQRSAVISAPPARADRQRGQPGQEALNQTPVPLWDPMGMERGLARRASPSLPVRHPRGGPLSCLGLRLDVGTCFVRWSRSSVPEQKNPFCAVGRGRPTEPLTSAQPCWEPRRRRRTTRQGPAPSRRALTLVPCGRRNVCFC